MSHFTVMVKVPKSQIEDGVSTQSIVEEMLVPYAEQDPEYYEFVPCDRDVKGEYEKYKEDDESFEDYLKENGYIVEDGEIGYMSNPNAQWDWYELGGRWAGKLPLKRKIPVAGEQRGEKSWGWGDQNPYMDEDGQDFVDMAKIEDVDWDRLQREAYASAQAAFQEYQAWATSGFPTNYPLHDMAAGLGCATLINEAEVTAYHEAKRKCQTDEERDALVEPERQFTYHTFSNEEEFLAKSIGNWAFSTYAVLDENGWHAPGEMGWFGVSSESAGEQLDWEANFHKRFIASDDPETVVAIMDCHI